MSLVPDEKLPAILLVDDQELNLKLMAAVLDDLRCEVVSSTSGREALRMLGEREFALVLLDVRMPDMDGFTVARHIRENTALQTIPIIFVTGATNSEESLFRGYESGAVDVLFKPVNTTILASKVQIFLDLHRHKKELERLVRAREQALAELDAFSYSVSHDLRAPLRPLAGFSSILLEDYGDKLDEEGKRLLERIANAAQRMEHIIEELLRLSRISRANVRIERVDLSALAAAVVAEVQTNEPRADKDAVEIVIAPSMTALADSQLLRIALDNLVRNAWKFTSKTDNPRIEIGARPMTEEERERELDDELASPTGTPTCYFVADNGVGFDPKGAAMLFKPFQRLHSVKEFDGTGIGLAIVRRVIQHHGGRIWADAAPNQGATFAFTLS